MDELGRDQFPKECRGCYENCYKCTRMINSVRLSVIRELLAKRIMKLQATARMQRDIEQIDEQLNALLSRSDK